MRRPEIWTAFAGEFAEKEHFKVTENGALVETLKAQIVAPGTTATPESYEAAAVVPLAIGTVASTVLLLEVSINCRAFPLVRSAMVAEIATTGDSTRNRVSSGAVCSVLVSQLMQELSAYRTEIFRPPNGES